MPSGPDTTASTSGVSDTHIITMSTSAASAAGLGETLAPWPAIDSAFDAVRFHTVTS